MTDSKAFIRQERLLLYALLSTLIVLAIWVAIQIGQALDSSRYIPFDAKTKCSRVSLDGPRLSEEQINRLIAEYHPTAPDGRTSTGLSNRNLRGADLSQRNLKDMNLYNADLTRANLAGTTLTGANLDCAVLLNANLSDVKLDHASLRGAQLRNSDLTRADLRNAILTSADLKNVIIEEARLRGATLNHAVYSPIAAPSGDYIADIKGLDSVTFPKNHQEGLVRLRELLRKSGLRKEERNATYAIESNIARYATQDQFFFSRVDGVARIIFFELTTGWGRDPWRAWLILGALWLGSALGYWFAVVPGRFWVLLLPDGASYTHAIYRVWLKEFLDPKLENRVTVEVKAERISAESWRATGWALYFSLLSAFHIGWRDVNLGMWFMRIQHREYIIRGHGWVRTVAGIQSLVSVYLFAIWGLSYFGRPFQ